MTQHSVEEVALDTLRLRFQGEDAEGNPLHELRAAHVAEVLQGLTGIASDFAKAGVFGDGPLGGEVFVRPAEEGSFVLEIVREVQTNPYAAAAAAVATATGVPSLSTVIYWATKSVRAGVKDFEYLPNGNVKVIWQDDTAQEIPPRAWEELQKRKRRRKKQLREILAPLSDERVASVEVTDQDPPAEELNPTPDVPDSFVLTHPDYDAAKPDNEIDETFEIFETEAQMSAIDFDDPEKWRVKTKDKKRAAIVKDDDFLGRVANSLAIRKSDVFQLRIREDRLTKNGRTKTTWTVLKVLKHKRGAHDDDA